MVRGAAAAALRDCDKCQARVFAAPLSYIYYIYIYIGLLGRGAGPFSWAMGRIFTVIIEFRWAMRAEAGEGDGHQFAASPPSCRSR